MYSERKFQSLIQRTPALALKITRSYSLLLRNLDAVQVETLGGKIFDYSKESSLIELGSSYMKLGNKNVASYMFQKYLEMYPNGAFTQKAQAALSKLPKIESRKNFSDSENIQYYHSGEIIFCEAELGKSVYVILEGEVKLIRNSGNSEITVNILNQGEIFGEMALLDNKPRSATAIANTNVKLAVVSKLNFESTTELNPELMTKIITFLSERIWLLHKKVRNHQIENLELKFADAFYIFYEQFKSRLSNQTLLEYPFTPEEFLNFIGLDFGKMEALLRFVHSCNFIKIEEGKIYCTNFQSLERYVQENRERFYERVG